MPGWRGRVSGVVPGGGPGVSVVIVGAGFGGIAAAIELRRHGFDDVTVLERANGLGGTWHYNEHGVREYAERVRVLDPGEFSFTSRDGT